MASKKSKVLAIAFCAAVMSGIYAPNVTYALPEAGLLGGYNPKDEQHVVYDNDKTTSESGIVVNDPNIKHPAVGNHTDQCGENLYDTDMTLGDFNKVVDDLVETDKNITNKVDEVSETVDKINDAYENGKLKGDKGDQGEKGDKGDTGAKGDSIASGSYDVKDGKVEMPIENDKGETVGNVTINDVASQTEVKQAQQTAEDAASLAGDALSTAKDVKDDLANETTARQEADADLQDQIDGHTNQISSIGKELNDLKANDEAQDADIDKLQKNDAVQDGILDAHGQQIGDNTAAIKNHTSVIGVEDNSQLKNEYADTNYISGANDMVEADVILDREISDVNSRVDGLSSRVDRLDDRIDKVGAMAAAIANLHTMGYDPAAPTEVAVGVGQYRDETGMALGLFHYPNRDFMLSLSVSTSGDEYMGGIGATWKFGRKSPEKVAEIKKAQAEADARRAEEQKLAKAEEMKKAAKEAKVQAQMERHAKLAAERAALEEA